MGNFLVGFVLPLLLLTAALLNWSLLSLVDVVAFLLILFNLPKIGLPFKRRSLIIWPIVIFSLFVILSQVAFVVVLALLGNRWSIADSYWPELIGMMRIQSWRSPFAIYFLVVQLLVVAVALVHIYGSRFSLVPSRDSWRGNFSEAIERLGSHLRVVSCLLLPAVQLVVGISHPSWVSLPFFIGSCIGLVEWSLTSNFLGLFSWWRFLRLYAGFNILLLYVYHLPIGLPKIAQNVADIIGLYKISTKSDWLEICSAISLVLFYVLVSYVKWDLEDMNSLMSMQGSNLTEQLLPSRHSFFIRESRSGVRHTNVLLRGAVFRTFCINFFTYGFPISLIALSFWSFHFASVCAFGLLVYVGYVLYAFPSLFRLHQLNGLLLVFILLWAVSTYIFNVAFAFLSWKLGKDMEIWEMIGFWHYPIPGFFLLAQFFLGGLVAVGNLVNNSVFQYLTDEAGQSSVDNCTVEVEDETKVLIVATVAWGLRKSSRAIMLALIFLIAMKSGFIHALYIVFFFLYLLSHSISRKVRQSLILLCEVHFAMLYILQLRLISEALDQKSSLSMQILSQLGLIYRDSFWELLEIALLACFCAVHNHGFEMLFSFSAIVQHAPSLPVGFSVLKAGLNKSVLLSVYSSRSARNSSESSSHVSERRIASFLNAVGQKCLSMYRSCGTYIAFLTILFAIYLLRPNYISFGYMFLLLIWLIGRQLFEKSRRPLWLPIKFYAIIVFLFIYCLSIFSSFEMWLSRKVDLYDRLGYNPEASLFQNVWETLAILIVMQLYSYERRQSKYTISDDPDRLETGVLGFFKRFLIWHIQKILLIAVFYVSLSPVSAFGFIFLVALVICSTLPKASRVPSKLFLVYTGLLVAAEYLFQMWGKQAKMFPGQKYSDISIILGFRIFKPGFWGIESALRGKFLVISACSLQYNVFHWLEKMETARSKAKWEEACPLFFPEDVSANGSFPREDSKPSPELSTLSAKQGNTASCSWPNFNFDQPQATHADAFNSGGSENIKKYSLGYIWGSTKESHKWNKKRIMSLKKERYEIQITTLKFYMKFWTENIFNLFGLEINMIVLLLASFALLNAISILYIASLAICILLRRRIIQKLWPIFVFLFASILILEYFFIWKNVSHGNASSETFCCHDCWSSSELYFHYCRSCWLGLIVDDPRMIISCYAVFMFSCFKLHADHLSSLSGSSSYHQMMSQRKYAFVWSDLSFETKSMWTFLDYLRLYCYCHLLDLVLALILITCTLEYDMLHLVYLGFGLVFFRMRFEILKKKNKIFKYLRIYNFAVIVLSLAYQSPFVGHFSAGTDKTIDYIYEMIGFHKYDYGFRITSRSALVEIIIFILVSLQSYMFSSQEFDYVFRYLEAEQIGAIVREQEKKAAWKTAQLKHIRESDEEKRLRNLQVEKMKAEMLNLQNQLHFMNSTTNGSITSPGIEGLRKRRTNSSNTESRPADNEAILTSHEPNFTVDSINPFELHEPPTSVDQENPSAVESREHVEDSLPSEISEFKEVFINSALDDSHRTEKRKGKAKESALSSAVQFLGDGVFQVQSIGNQAVTNLASLLNVAHEDLDSNEHSSSEDGAYDELESQKRKDVILDRSSSLQSDTSRNISNATGPQIGRIFRHIWSLIQSNNDVVCYCCFILVFLWSFSLLSMVYLAALFLYALCVNTGPNYIFWVLMLIYTEIYIFLQYLYQILIQHCGLSIPSDILQEWGFPTHPIKSSFVISVLPIFLVYLFTLIQSSITAKDGEFMSSTEYGFHERRFLYQRGAHVSSSWNEKAQRLLQPITNSVRMLIRSLSWYWKSLAQGIESPPYFVQLSLDVHLWPEQGIQPERIESGINQLLRIVHDEICKELNPHLCPYSSRIHIQSIERSQDNPEVALAVLEVVYAASLTRCISAGWYKSLTPAADVAKEILIAQNSGYVEELGFPYPILSVIGGGKREVDLYAYIFGADLSVFFLVAIFYQSVIKNNSEFLEVYQLEDQFPKEFVFVLMIIFFLIVLDRIIYLCSFATWKLLFYLFNLVLFTYSVTEYAWNMEPSQRHAGGLALRAIYLMKAVSLALQAVQIRYGIPHQSTLYRQYLTCKVSRINHLGYRIYRALPFLYELRCVLDWSCTTTSLTMYDWLKLEDIYASLYLVKCDAVLNRAEHKIGTKQTKMTKFCSGICLFFILICVIWAPMLMYSSGNPTNVVNPIKDVTAQLDIKTVAGRLTLYQSTLCERTPWYKVDSSVDLDPQHVLDTYDKADIQLICCQADASILWLVPFVVQEQFIQSLSLDWDIMDITFSWVLNRERPKGKEVVKYERSVEYPDLPKQSDVQEVFNGTTNSFRIANIYPKYFRVTGSGEVRPFEQEESAVSADLILNRGSPEWWSFRDTNLSDTSGCGGLTGPMAIFVSEETPPQGILGDTLSKFSIWGLYITFVLAVGRFIRLQCSDLRMRIPYENLPSCDRLIAICEDIYAARAEGELGVEEVLYWTIVNIYRSPHMLLGYTKPD